MFSSHLILLSLLIRILIWRISKQYRVMLTTMHPPPPRMMRMANTVWNPVYVQLLTIIYYDWPCFGGWRRWYTSEKVEQQKIYLSNIRFSHIKNTWRRLFNTNTFDEIVCWIFKPSSTKCNYLNQMLISTSIREMDQ